MNSSETRPSTHFEAWLERRKIPWLVVVIILPTIIFFSELPYGLMLSEGGVKRNGAYAAVIIAYSLICVAVIRFFFGKVFLSLQSLINDLKLVEKKEMKFEWQAALITSAALTFFSVNTMPEVSGYEGGIELSLFIGGTALANAVLGWILFMLILSVRQITKLVSRVVVTNIFDITPFYPVAQWCLAVAVSIMGVVTIATLFLKEDMLLEINLITYAITLCVGIFVFFAGMWSTHQLMQRIKQEEIKKLDHQLSKLHIRVLQMIEGDEIEEADPLFLASSRLAAQKKLVEEIPAWPYTMGNLGSLLTSVSVPVIINILLSFLK